MIIYKEKVVIYMISYEKLVKKLRENNISQYKLKQEKILGSATI